MGCFQSKPEVAKPKQSVHKHPSAAKYAAPSPDSVEQLVADTNFSTDEVNALKELFGQVSNSVVQDGLIHKEEFFVALFASQEGNLFADRIFDMFDSKKNKVIEFGEFVRGLSVFHPKAPMDDKIKFAFSIYDKDGSNYISKDEVKDFLFALMRENNLLHFTDEELDAVIEQTFEEVDLAKDGKIHPAEWQTFCENYPVVINYMTLPVLRDLTARFPGAVK
mmetsp:Transcript_8128/g.23325  ORF Transcript_8128/g.23325 Transcript_8128/m.23325 type:complete len:221 (-) Transcript_8128:33-695(-)|eukprot:CAMPEP_0117652216 /NCGR_PEP_ID=MMETSP0804-20121206/2509_1 /TAXON_ID=1074897 /ORGANISM="Tetraselmis astigmatica, Strain CCMP880" /LENGTH=220 /DNA_ID=CAMNT_0005458249 /DNA_START=1719 /DNA_END=2381 /DNA_ORIENTATION=-